MSIEKKDILLKIDGTLTGIKMIPKKNLEQQAPASLAEDLNGIIDMAVALDSSKASLYPRKFTFSADFGGMPPRTMASYQELLIFLQQIQKVIDTL